MRALGKPKGRWRRIWDAFVLVREEANAAVDKLRRPSGMREKLYSLRSE